MPELQKYMQKKLQIYVKIYLELNDFFKSNRLEHYQQYQTNEAILESSLVIWKKSSARYVWANAKTKEGVFW